MGAAEIWSLAISILALIGSAWSAAITYFARPMPSGWKRSVGIGPEGDVKFIGYQVTIVNLGKVSLFIEAVGWYFPEFERVEQPVGELSWGNEGEFKENPGVPRTLNPGESLNWYFPSKVESEQPIAACYYQRNLLDIFKGNGKLARKFVVIEKIKGGGIRHFEPVD